MSTLSNETCTSSPKLGVPHSPHPTLTLQTDIVPLLSSTSISQPTKSSDPLRKAETKRYMPDNVVARIAYQPADGEATFERLERLANQTGRLVDTAKGATGPAAAPKAATVLEPTTNL